VHTYSIPVGAECSCISGKFSMPKDRVYKTVKIYLSTRVCIFPSVFLELFHIIDLDLNLFQIQTCYSKPNYSQVWKWLFRTRHPRRKVGRCCSKTK
jgi:hypothetical protein